MTKRQREKNKKIRDILNDEIDKAMKCELLIKNHPNDIAGYVIHEIKQRGYQIVEMNQKEVDSWNKKQEKLRLSLGIVG